MGSVLPQVSWGVGAGTALPVLGWWGNGCRAHPAQGGLWERCSKNMHLRSGLCAAEEPSSAHREIARLQHARAVTWSAAPPAPLLLQCFPTAPFPLLWESSFLGSSCLQSLSLPWFFIPEKRLSGAVPHTVVPPALIAGSSYWTRLSQTARLGPLRGLWVSSGSWQRVACWIPWAAGCLGSRAALPLPGYISFLGLRAVVG